MQIALVGATGVLGRALVPLLIRQGHRVRVLARSRAKAQAVLPPEIEITEGDLLDANADLVAFLRGCEGAAHIATAIPSDPSVPGAWDLNTRLRREGTRRLVEAALQAGVRRYVQQSITMVYPNHDDDWITEDAAFDPAPERAGIVAPVMEMERLVRAVPADRLAWCILRGGAFVGVGTFQDADMARLRAGQAIVPGDGRNFLSLIHAADMASAVAAAFERAPAGSIFQIVAEPLRQGDYFDRLADMVGAVHPPRDPGQPRPPSWRCSNTAARATLGWQPTHSLFPTQEGI